jgi:hypothetical protein
MKVSAQYAQEHFADILTAIDTGERVKLTFPGDLLIQEASSPGAHLEVRSVGSGDCAWRRRF